MNNESTAVEQRTCNWIFYYRTTQFLSQFSDSFKQNANENDEKYL